MYSNLEYKDIGILARRSVSLRWGLEAYGPFKLENFLCSNEFSASKTFRAIYEYCGEASSLDTMLDGVKVFAQVSVPFTSGPASLELAFTTL